MFLNHLPLIVALLTIVWVAQFGQAARILSVFPAVSKSHFAVGEALSVGLARAGHQVTLISPYDYKSPVDTLEGVQVTGALEIAEERTKHFHSADQFNLPAPVVMPLLFWQSEEFANFTLMHTDIRHLMDTRSYDLVIVEIFCTEAFIGLGQHFGAPVIGVSTFGGSKWTNDLVGTPAPLSTVPHAFSTFTDQMNIWQRLGNTATQLLENGLINVIHHPQQRKVYNEAFPNAKVSYDEAVNNVSLVLLNSHFSINWPRPYVPNMIEVGGMHINRKTNPLPEKIQKFLDSATDGAIFFSLGSFIKSSIMSARHKEVFVKVLGSLKQKVIWKFEEPLDVPPNIMISSWLPQNDIFAHTNVKLFISHGGLLSTTEAVYHSLPVLGMPFFGDQVRNIEGFVESGWALRVDYKNVTEESLRWAIAELINNKKYQENVKLVSQRYRDQPMTPIDTAIYWCEYVIRHRGAPQLRSSAMNLNFVEYHNLDVFLIIAIASILFTFVFFITLKWSCRKCFGKKKGIASNAPNKKRK